MSESAPKGGEGGLHAPTRHPLGWQQPEFYDESLLLQELERVYHICHGCRRCVSLCHAFPVLFDLVDESPTMEVDGIAKSDYMKVVDQCYLCDLCYQTKCPYVPPHEWNVDFPHLMLRAKAVQFKKGEVPASRKLLTNTTSVGKLASIPVVTETVNAANRSPLMRKLLDKTLGVHPQAHIPVYHSKTARKLVRPAAAPMPVAAGPTRGRVAVFVTCYGNYNMPQAVDDLVTVLRHNHIEVKLIEQEQCCGMPKLELGDLDSVRQYKEFNLPRLSAAVKEGWDIMAPIPSCVLMFRQEIPLMFPDEAEVQEVKAHIFDPFEYLMHRHKAALLDTRFKQPLGKLAYHAPCHQRVQNIGPKTRDFLALIPGTEIELIERCSGHDGTYGVRSETYELSMKLLKPVVSRAKNAEPDFVTSDCPMAADHIAHGMGDGRSALHPVSLVRRAYGL
ncbi:MAG: heterodisulfide reductase-related iron-sulfur binding cluster [Stenotrophobium sp.]